jgi:hypothetical protein
VRGHQQPVRRDFDVHEAALAQIVDDRLDLGFGRRVAGEELFVREVLAVMRVAGPVHVVRELLELRGVAQLQADDDVRRLAGREFERRRRAARHQLRAGQKGFRMGIDPIRRRMGRGGGEHERDRAREVAGRRKGQRKPGVPFHRESF